MHFYEIIANNLNQMQGQIISFIGGGGKTSLALQIGNELAGKGFKVIVTTTTKIESVPGVPLVLVKDNFMFEQQLESTLKKSKLVMVADRPYKADKLMGLAKHALSMLLSYADLVLVESDGSRQRSLKTHKDREPVIPSKSTTVAIVCGADVVGKKLEDGNVHRAALFSEKWKIKPGSRLTAEIIASELLSPNGYLKNIPLRAQIVLFVNKADTDMGAGQLLANKLQEMSDYPVYLGSPRSKFLTRVN